MSLISNWRYRLTGRAIGTLLVTVVAGSVFVSAAHGQAPQVAPGTQVARAGTVTTYEPNHFPKRERSYYELFWGVDSLNAKSVESGELIKFTFRVIDPEKAKPLNDKTLQPVMYDPAIRAKLVIPTLEKVGQLRQAQTPEAGVTYWMAFSNPGRVVKRGDRVTVVIGDFHIEGLLVQ